MKDILENFITILFDYTKTGKITYEGEVVFSLIEEDEIEGFADILEKDYRDKVILNEDSISGDIRDIQINEEIIEGQKCKGLSFKDDINEYRYVSDEYSTLDLGIKFKNLYELAGNEAVDWLIENAVNYWRGSLEEEINEKKSFDDVVSSEEFNDKMQSEMDKVINELEENSLFESGKYVDFELSDDNVDIEFEITVSDENIDEEEAGEFLQDINLAGVIIEKIGTVVEGYGNVFLRFANMDISIDGETLNLTAEFKKVQDVEEDRDLKEAVATRPAESINPRELIKVVDIDELLSIYDGEQLFDLLKNKDLLHADKDDYTKVEVYPSSKPGSIVLVFITEIFGYEQEESVRVEVRILGSRVISLLEV